MRTFCRLLLVSFLCVVFSLFAVCSGAQVLARPGWAGSGVTPEQWWKRAVFYRIQPALFQDSTSSGVGDLNGIAQRLDYIHALGADAIILVPPFRDDDFGDLALAASRDHLRVLVQLASADPARARFWLNQGAAGLFIDPATLGSSAAQSLKDLRHLVDSLPGDRVLIGPPVYAHPADAPQLTLEAEISAGPEATAASLRRELLPLRDESLSQNTNPLIELHGWERFPSSPPGAGATPGAGKETPEAGKETPEAGKETPEAGKETPEAGRETPEAGKEIVARTLAAMAFASRGAVVFDAGRELGLETADGKPAVMQWTPANVTRAVPPPAPPKAPAPNAVVYGAYTPYVPPPKLKMAPPLMPPVVPAERPPVDPDTLRGFTAGAAPENEAANGASASAATEDRDPGSMLNFFRHLIALHHENWTVRNGAEYVLNRDAADAVVWLRRAPAGTRTTDSVVVAANLSSAPVTLDLSADAAQAGMHPGELRALLTATTSAAGGALQEQSTQQLVLPAFTFYLGELSYATSSKSYSVRRRR